ncbi:MAG: TIGR03943 family protein [Clostridia bacterium]|nr:TIGR03943 family protein [Clostridia bacterium]
MLKLNRIYKELIIFSYILGSLFICLTGKLNKFLNPKMNIYFYIFIGIMCVLLVFEIKDVLKSKDRKSYTLRIFDILYILPITFLFFIGNGSLSAETVGNKGLNVTSVQTSLNTTGNANDNKGQKDIEVTNENYMDTISEISYNVENYIGKKIKVTGFIHKDNNLASDKFVLGRLYMSCCTADSQVIGYICSYEKQSDLEENSWYQVEAVINKTVYSGEETALLDITSIVKIDKPENEYVF